MLEVLELEILKQKLKCDPHGSKKRRIVQSNIASDGRGKLHDSFYDKSISYEDPFFKIGLLRQDFVRKQFTCKTS